ncbi:hypothetical protein FACS1894193_00940 [Bacilli bacterium]|nr:hypothetical protein FACS1894192_00010 [Bacilli bacterium]GHU39819.1 hypothetical protein FACS1894193_00940 [Bacilli bacterium]
MLKKILLFSTVLVLIIAAFQLYQTKSDDSTQAKVNKIVITDKSEQALYDLINRNLTAINQKKMEDYLATLIPTARQNSQKEITTFLNSYTVKINLESFQVLKKDKTHCLIETKQKTINLGKNKYRNHISTANHTLTKLDGKWLIASTTMIDTEFLN